MRESPTPPAIAVENRLRYPQPMAPTPETWPTRRFTADEVLRMLEVGVLSPDEPVELIEGELIMVPPQGPVHGSLSVVVRGMLEHAYGPGHHVRTHTTVQATPDSLPEPDVAVVQGSARDYLERLPGPRDVPLIVEVADSSVAIDRRKASLYARAGFPAYWLLDVQARRLEVLTDPTQDGLYRQTNVLSEDAEVIPPGTTTALRVSELLP